MSDHQQRAMARMEELDAASLKPQEIVDLQLPDHVAKLMDWIPKKRYLQLYGETEAAVLKRISSKAWVEGVQWARPVGAGLWISIKGVNFWAQKHVREREIQGQA